MALQAQKVSGAFEKQVPSTDDKKNSLCFVTNMPSFLLEVVTCSDDNNFRIW